MIVTADLRVVSSISSLSGDCCLRQYITSMLWLGPALLFSTGTGHILQLDFQSNCHEVRARSEPLGTLVDGIVVIGRN